MPMISVEYKEGIKYTYKPGKGRKNLKKALLQACDGYCMYCYAKVKIDGKDYSHLEHAVEKDFSDKLCNCVPNIGLACATCNTSFKKCEQLKKEEIDNKILLSFDTEKCQDASHCYRPCRAYINLRGHCVDIRPMVFQPPLSDGSEKEFGIKYNVLTGLFQPSSSDSQIQAVVLEHIRRFNLNEKPYKTIELLKYCRDVVESNVVQRQKGRYGNRLVDVFIDYISGVSDADVIRLCQMIYAMNDINPQGEVVM